MSLKKNLKIFFGRGEKRVVLVGVGNPYRGDDGAGSNLIEILKTKSLNNTLLINAESVPEAFITRVEEYNPSHVLIIDAANFHGVPGDMRFITSEQIGGQTISTHSLPLNIFISYVEKTLGVPVLLLGIQPASIIYGEELSPNVVKSVKILANTLFKILME
jgi:hydrogenase 3 maturation protease